MFHYKTTLSRVQIINISNKNITQLFEQLESIFINL